MAGEKLACVLLCPKSNYNSDLGAHVVRTQWNMTKHSLMLAFCAPFRFQPRLGWAE